MNIKIFLGDKNFIHKRRIYDTMNFLGDAGGIYGSMMFIGAVLHFFLSFSEEPT